MLSARYQDEMQKLRTLVAEFLRDHPSLAPLFGGPTVDPDVERLLEGSAFLAASLRERLDDDWPEIVRPLIEQLQPRWLRPMPSATMVAFTPNPSQTKPVTILKGSRISSRPEEGVSCQFTTCWDVVVEPITLLDAAFHHPVGEPPAIRLSFQLHDISPPDWSASTLRLFLGDGFPRAADLNLVLSRHLAFIEVKGLEEGASCRLAPERLIPLSGTKSNPLLACLPDDSPGLTALLDYFACPETFLFVEVTGLDHWRERGRGSQFELSFVLKNELPVPAPVVDRSSFLLAATPAVNLFPHTAEPITHAAKSTKLYCPVVPAGKEKEHCSVWSVDDVTGLLKSGSARKRQYRADSSAGDAPSGEPCYRTAVKLRPLSAGVDLSLELHRSEEVEASVTVEITCTNGSLPAKLGIGDLSVPTVEMADGVTVRNVTPVTPPSDPPLEPGRLWKLYTCSRLYKRMLSQPEAVRSVLATLAASVRSDREGLSRARARIGGIEKISVRERDILRGGVPWRGIEVVLKLNGKAYESLGELYLFAAVFERFLGGFVSENYLVRLIVEDSAGSTRYAWDARPGDLYEQ